MKRLKDIGKYILNIAKDVIDIVITVLILLSCTSHPSVPTSFTTVNDEPIIYPDYKGVVIPPNIAPLNFGIRGNVKDCVARFSYNGKEITFGSGYKVLIDEDEWKEMLSEAKGKDIKVEIFTKEDGQWIAYKPFTISVANEDIDPYISYRLIQPSYVAYEKLVINQRNLTSFEESNIYNNMLVVSNEGEGQCINCHSYQNYKTDHMLFHMRQSYGGTMIVDGNKLKKVDLKTDSTISAGVYPSWHPTLNLVAFSTNMTGQTFHTKSTAKVEVQDKASDLILYDVEKDEIYNVANDSNEFEIFPTWSADGKTLYYCSAHFEYLNDSLTQDAELIQRYKDLHYNIYAKSFNAKTKKFGPRRLIYDAATNEKSASLPRVSPDGRYMVFALGTFGCFHVWHEDADIYLLDLKTHKVRNLEGLNSERSESYPSFSSNGRWIMTDSRRDDGNYTRPYISYFDKKGVCHKAFELPQQDPNYYTFLLRSFNRPEFMKEPVKVKPEEFAIEAKKEAKKVKFVK